MAGSLARHGSMHIKAVHWLMTRASCSGCAGSASEARGIANVSLRCAATEERLVETALREARPATPAFDEVQADAAVADLCSENASAFD